MSFPEQLFQRIERVLLALAAIIERVLLASPAFIVNTANIFVNTTELVLRKVLRFIEDAIQFILETAMRVARALLDHILRVIPMLWRLGVAVYCITVFLLPFLAILRYGREINFFLLELVGWLCIISLSAVVLREITMAVFNYIQGRAVMDDIPSTDVPLYKTDLFRRFLAFDCAVILFTAVYLSYSTQTWFGFLKTPRFLLLPLSNI